MLSNDDKHGDGADISRLLRTIAGDPAGPSEVDIGRAMRRGRTVRRVRAAVASSLAVVALTGAGVGVAYVRDVPRDGPVVAAGPSTSPQPGDCTLARLDLPAGIKSGYVSAGDPTGRFFAGVGFTETAQVGILWDNDVPKVFSVSGARVVPTDINEHGVVIGTLEDARHSALFRYANGSVEELGTGIADGFVMAPSVNKDGVVVATVAIKAGNRAFAVTYAAGSTQPVPLPGQDAGKRYSAVHIADDGSVLAVRSDQGQQYRPELVTVARDGGMRTIAHPPGLPESYNVHARTTTPKLLAVTDIQDTTIEADDKGFLWNTEAGTSQPIALRAMSVNSSGHISGVYQDNRPAVLRDGVVKELPMGSPDERGRPEAMADNGTIAGWLTTALLLADWTRYPVIWRGC